jgi:hypothetical protein
MTTWKSPQRRPSDISLAGIRGPREDDLWKELLPKARQRLVDAGIFNPDGTLTSQGKRHTTSYILRALAISLFTVSLLALSSDSNASTCLRSAQAVKHAFPGSWPSWHRAGGTKCWEARGRREDAQAVPPPAVAGPSRPGEAVRHVKTVAVAGPPMSTLGWTFRSHTATVGPRDAEKHAFDDRWKSMLLIGSLNQPSVMQQLMDPIGVVP